MNCTSQHPATDIECEKQAGHVDAHECEDALWVDELNCYGGTEHAYEVLAGAPPAMFCVVCKEPNPNLTAAVDNSAGSG